MTKNTLRDVEIEYLDAMQSGQISRAREIAKQIPMSPNMYDYLKRIYGAEWIKENGVIRAEAE